MQEICYNLTIRRVRITYTGAYHHVMNRGYDGNPIFAGNVTRSHFLDYLESAVTEMKMRIFAYCIMDNHYHMVLENTTGKMSDFMKLLKRDELYYEPVEKVIQEFQTRNDIDIYAMIEIFRNLKFSTLRSMYRNMKQKRAR